ncbi:MAG: AAA family ATPase [Pseudomonadota bacterium]
MPEARPIRSWLADLGLEQYAEAFEAGEVGFDLLGDLDHETLRELGVGVVGHRLKILKAARNPRTYDVEAHGLADGPLAERRQLTIMFCDLVGSTALSNRLDPEDYRDLMQLYQDTVSGVVVQFGGHVAQFLGDGLMVYFGYPVAQEDAPERAVRAGLAAIHAVSEIETQPDVNLSVRVGVATGLVVVGDLIGERVAQISAVAGETPNLAARLQSIAEPDQIVVGDSTRRLLGGLFRFKVLEGLALKGFSAPMTAWRVVEAVDAVGRFDARAEAELTPLIGREGERARLLARWKQAHAGQGGTVLLSGEAGIGKSRLVREMLDEAAAGGAVIKRYQCAPFFSNSLLYPVLRQIEREAGFAPDDDGHTRRQKALRLFDVEEGQEEAVLLASALLLPMEDLPALDLSPALRKARTLQALVDQIVGAAAAAPLLVILEDAHWLDPTTTELLEMLFARLSDLPALVVVTHRPEYEPPWQDDEVIERLALERLQAQDCARLISALSAGAGVPEEVCADLVDRADGVPLYLEELTTAVLDRAGTSPGDHFVPASLKDSLMARLDRLLSAKEIAQVASVIGREFPLALLSAVAEETPEPIEVLLEQLVAADLVRAGPGADTWHFRHALLQDAAYDSILKRRRVELHRAIAETLLADFPSRAAAEPEFVAHHLAAGGETARAVEQWHAAGQRAWQRAAAKEALAHLGKGLEQVEAIADDTAQETMELKLQSTLGVVHFAATGYASPQAKAAFERALELCDTVDDIDLRFGVYYGIGAYETMKGDITAGHAAFRLLQSAGAEAGSPRYDVYTESMLTWSHYNRGDFAEAIAHGGALNALYEAGAWTREGPRLSAADPKVIAECFRAASVWAVGRPDSATAISDAVVDYARELGDPYSLVYTLTNSAIRVPYLIGDLDTVLARTEEGIALANELGYGFLGAFASFWRAWALAARGEAETAVEMSAAALAGCAKAGVRYHGSLFKAHHAEVLLAAGRAEEARAALPASAEGVAASGEFSLLPELHLVRGRVLQGLGDDAAAVAAWQASLAEAEQRDALSWSLQAGLALAERFHARGEPEKAVGTLLPIIERFEEGFGTADLSNARALLARCGVDHAVA